MLEPVSNPYIASWPKSLEPVQKNLVTKATELFWNVVTLPIWVVSGYLRNIALRIIVPGTPDIGAPPNGRLGLAKLFLRFVWNPENFKANLSLEGEDLLRAFRGQGEKIQTADGATLDCAYFPKKNVKKVILFIGGNAQQWENSGSWLESLKVHDASVLMLNNRGVGKSTGKRYEDGYALDVFSAAKWLINKKGVDPEDILFAGFSMGAASTTKGAALIQEEYPEKNISALNINSFSTLSLEIQTVLSGFGLWGKLGTLATRLLGIEMDVTSDFEKLKGKKIILYNAKDSIIPRKAQLERATKKGEAFAFPASEEHVPYTLEEISICNRAIRSLLKSSWWRAA